MKITREKCQEIIDYNTTGKGKNNPSFTALVNAKRWLSNIEFWEGRGLYQEWSLPDHEDHLNL